MLKADLHMHTTISDGKERPASLVKLAAESKLAMISITDHDTIDAYPEASVAAKKAGIELLQGVEITSSYNGYECHILAYNFKPDDINLTSLLSRNRKLRIDRAKRIVRNLNKQGYDIDYDDVLAEAGSTLISRNHISQILIRKGYASNTQQVFSKLIGTENVAFESTDFSPVSEVITLIGNAGGISVLAHPSKVYKYTDLQYFLKSGIRGIEYIHPSHSVAIQEKIKKYADNYGLKLTGGSDFHGIRPSDYDLIGRVAISYDLAKQLIS